MGMSNTATEIAALRPIATKLAASVTGEGLARLALTHMERDVAYFERPGTRTNAAEVARMRRQHVATVREAIRFDARRAA